MPTDEISAVSLEDPIEKLWTESCLGLDEEETVSETETEVTAD